MIRLRARRPEDEVVEQPRVVVLAVLAGLLALPALAGPARADHTGSFRPPPPPRPPAHTVQHEVQEPALEPQPRVGPRVRVRRTVAAGAPLVLPAVTGRVHVVCKGRDMRGALLWLQRDATGRTEVHRYDGGRLFDLTYRVVRGGTYTVRERCP